MCRQHLTQYWCQCEQDAGYEACGSGTQIDGCPELTYDTVYMQCFCNSHATKKFKTEKKHQRHERKKSRSSLSSNDTASSRNSRYSDTSLVDQEKGQQGPVLRRRWYRPWSRSF
ncbi:hypothetical protein BJX99DRAFT_229997 [Aspergillus californicus]